MHTLAVSRALGDRDFKVVLARHPLSDRDLKARARSRACSPQPVALRCGPSLQPSLQPRVSPAASVYANFDLGLYSLWLYSLWLYSPWLYSPWPYSLWQVYANSDSELPWKESLVTAEPEVGRHCSKYGSIARAEQRPRGGAEQTGRTWTAR